jgi:hypothetical protein
MKEDIFEKLKYHSGLVAQGCWNELDEYDREAIKRFGDLIVRECAKEAYRFEITVEEGLMYKRRIIEKFFGVEDNDYQ